MPFEVRTIDDGLLIELDESGDLPADWVHDYWELFEQTSRFIVRTSGINPDSMFWAEVARWIDRGCRVTFKPTTKLAVFVVQSMSEFTVPGFEIDRSELK